MKNIRHGYRSPKHRLAARLQRIERRTGTPPTLDQLLAVEHCLFAVDRLEQRHALHVVGWSLRAKPYAKGREGESKLRMCAPRSTLGVWQFDAFAVDRPWCFSEESAS